MYNQFDIINRYSGKDIIVLKHKKEPLNLEISTGLNRKIKIYTDSERLYVGYKSILLKDIRKVSLDRVRMYLDAQSRKFFNSYSLNLSIYQKPFGNNIRISLYYLEALLEDGSLAAFKELNKIREFLDWFVFSNDIDTDKFESDEYVPIGNNTPYLKTNIDIKNNLKQIFIKGNKKFISHELGMYRLYLVLPIKYAKKFIKQKEYLVYKSCFMGNGYIDIWLNCEVEKNANEILKKKEKVRLIKLVLLLLFLIIIFCIKAVVFDRLGWDY